MNLQSQVKMLDGNTIPIMGYGVWEISREETYNCVLCALRIGYRQIDSARWYENEAECGQAIKAFLKENPQVSREDICFTTKLMFNNGLEDAREAIRTSIKDCGLEYIDLYLIHAPIGGPQMRRESWEACVEAQKEGLIKSIGVSNYGVGHINEMLQYGDLPLPAVNQIDLHPFQTRVDLVKFCKKHNITLQAWAPLARGMRFDHPTVVKLAEKHSKTVAQILIRYSLQKGYIPLPKSANPERIQANADVFGFELSQDEMNELDGLDEQLLTDWDPTTDP